MCDIFFRGAYCTVESCLDKRNNEYLSVKIIDVPKMTATTGLTLDGKKDTTAIVVNFSLVVFL